MKNLSKQEKILLSILGIAIVFYLYYTFFLTPVLKDISVSKDKISNYEVQLSDISAKEIQIKSLNTKLDELQLKYNDVIDKYPLYEKDPQIGMDLKAQADKNGVSIQSVSYTPSVNVSGTTTDTKDTTAKAAQFDMKYETVNLSVSGTYSSILNYVNSIENAERYTVVTSLSINKSDSGITGTITANYYFINDNKNNNTNSYSFNNKTYGKSDLFK